MSNTHNNLADNTNWKPQSIVDIACLYKEWWVSLAASVLSKAKNYFRNVLMSCQHSWQCNIQMSHYQVCWQLVTAFHKTGKLCYIRFVALRIPLIWGVKVLHISMVVIKWNVGMQVACCTMCLEGCMYIDFGCQNHCKDFNLENCNLNHKNSTELETVQKFYCYS